MAGTPFLIGPAEQAALAALRELAAQRPLDMPAVVRQIKTRAGMRAHKRQMTTQSILLPFGFMVTFSIELNHPVGACRHMSMSSPVKGRVPLVEAVWMVAVELGFVGEQPLSGCKAWLEDLDDGAQAVNVVQPIMTSAQGTA